MNTFILTCIGGALAGIAVGGVIVYYGTRAMTARSIRQLAEQDPDEAQARRAVLLARGDQLVTRARFDGQLMGEEIGRQIRHVRRGRP